jgi:hypothetical protein
LIELFERGIKGVRNLKSSCGEGIKM